MIEPVYDPRSNFAGCRDMHALCFQEFPTISRSGVTIARTVFFEQSDGAAYLRLLRKQ